MAVDVGTTTVVAHLIDLTTGKTIDTEATYNSQMNFGEDYIRRIIYAEQTNSFDQLQDRLVNAIIDRTGRLKAADDPRLTEGNDGTQFQLVEPQNSHHEIAITQADINNLIRSKAGVFAAIRILMNATQTKLDDIDTVYIAGGFGNFLNVQRAVTIGMLLDVPPARLQFVGNTSVAGAKTSLCSQKALETAERIAESMTYFDLMGNPDYSMTFFIITKKKERETLYVEAYRVLKQDGLFSVYPKHTLEDDR